MSNCPLTATVLGTVRTGCFRPLRGGRIPLDTPKMREAGSRGGLEAPNVCC
jgi:hypothetical protein